MRRPDVARGVSRVLLEGERQWKLYDLRAWVVMPNHGHVLLLPRQSLVRVLPAVKSASARRANRILGRPGQRFWQEESFDRWVRDREEEGRTAISIGIRYGRAWRLLGGAWLRPTWPAPPGHDQPLHVVTNGVKWIPHRALMLLDLEAGGR